MLPWFVEYVDVSLPNEDSTPHPFTSMGPKTIPFWCFERRCHIDMLSPCPRHPFRGLQRTSNTSARIWVARSAPPVRTAGRLEKSMWAPWELIPAVVVATSCFFNVFLWVKNEMIHSLLRVEQVDVQRFENNWDNIGTMWTVTWTYFDGTWSWKQSAIGHPSLSENGPLQSPSSQSLRIQHLLVLPSSRTGQAGPTPPGTSFAQVLRRSYPMSLCSSLRFTLGVQPPYKSI